MQQKLLAGVVIAFFAIGSIAPVLADPAARGEHDHAGIGADVAELAMAPGAFGSFVSGGDDDFVGSKAANSGRGNGSEPDFDNDQDPGAGNNFEPIIPGNSGGDGPP